jgi:hypothetical protein
MQEGYRITIDRLQEMMQIAFPKLIHMKQCGPVVDDSACAIATVRLECEAFVSVGPGEYADEAAVWGEIENRRQDLREVLQKWLSLIDVE